MSPVPQVLCLWLHECSRVFEDRLINDEDHGWFRGRQEALLAELFETSYGELVTTPRLIYGDFMVPGTSRLPHPLPLPPEILRLLATAVNVTHLLAACMCCSASLQAPTRACTARSPTCRAWCAWWRSIWRTTTACPTRP